MRLTGRRHTAIQPLKHSATQPVKLTSKTLVIAATIEPSLKAHFKSPNEIAGIIRLLFLFFFLFIFCSFLFFLDETNVAVLLADCYSSKKLGKKITTKMFKKSKTSSVVTKIYSTTTRANNNKYIVWQRMAAFKLKPLQWIHRWHISLI